MLSKYDYEKIAEEISEDYIQNEKPLNEGIKNVSITLELNPEQIKRITEAANIKTYNKMYDKLEDKTFTFDLGDSKKVIDEVYSDDNKQEVEIKDMPPVEYEASKNPKAPEDNYEVLGDDNELPISKNTANSEDSAGDSMLDSLKVPKKDYSYSENPIEESEEEEESDEVGESEDAEDVADEDEDEENKKEASFKDNKEEIKIELENRSMLLADQLVSDLSKTASFFRGSDRNTKFAEFVKNAAVLHQGNECLAPVLESLVKEARIDVTSPAKKSFFSKVASKNAVGMKQLNSLLKTYEEFAKVDMAYKSLD